MVLNIKHLAVASVVVLATTSGALAQETGGIKLPASVVGGNDYVGTRSEVSFATTRPDYEPDGFMSGADSFIRVTPMETGNEMAEMGSEPARPNDDWDGGTSNPNDLLNYRFDDGADSGFGPSSFGTPNGPSSGPPVLKNSLEFSGWNGTCWVWEGVCY